MKPQHQLTFASQKEAQSFCEALAHPDVLAEIDADCPSGCGTPTTAVTEPIELEDGTWLVPLPEDLHALCSRHEAVCKEAKALLASTKPLGEVRSAADKRLTEELAAEAKARADEASAAEVAAAEDLPFASRR